MPAAKTAMESIADDLGTPPKNVIEALARIMGELPAIAKKKHPSADGKGVTYPYRGIEEITAEAQGLFAKYGVVLIPYKTVSLETREFQVSSGATWTDEKVETHWRIYGPGGVDDFIEAQTLGIGRDNSDKGFNKAATQCLKYLMLPMLLVADPKDDNDGTTVENDGEAKTTTRPSPVTRRAQPFPPPVIAESAARLNSAIGAVDDGPDYASMDLPDVTRALEAAGLPLTGTLNQKRLRLQEHALGVSAAQPAGGRMITEPMIPLVQILMGKLGLEEHSVRMAEIEARTGQVVSTTAELTYANARKLIDGMKADLGED
jgi:ERF superfamily